MSFDEDDDDSMREGSSQKIILKNDKFTTFHMVAFIITCVAGREYANWNPALSGGFGQFIIAQLLLAFAFINSYFCLAEIWSAIPFSGGGHGLARAVMGFYSGFLVGIADAMVYITHSSVGALFLGDTICEVANLPSSLTLVFVFVVYLVAVLLAIQPSTVVLRRSFVVLAVLSLLILFVYIFGSFGWSNFHENASLHRAANPNDVSNWFSGGIKGFMFYLPIASQPYAGVKSFTLMCALTVAPKVTLPKAVKIGVPFIFMLNMFVVFVFASQPGGILNTASLRLPMMVGWQKMFDMTADAAYHLAGFLTYPAAFGKVYAFMIPCGVLLQSLGRTNLLPSVLLLHHNKDHSQGTIVSATLGFLMCVLIHFQPEIDLYNICMICTVFSNVTTAYCYIKLKIANPTLKRGYVNPLGSVGAALSALLFLLMFVSAAFLQANYDGLIGAVVIFVLCTIYYFGFAARTQTLCKEEDKVMLMLHVKNFNRNKSKNKKFKGNRAQIPNYKSKEVSINNSQSVRDVSRVSPESTVSNETPSGLLVNMRMFNIFKCNSVAPNVSSTQTLSSVFPVATSTVVPSERVEDLSEELRGAEMV